MGKKLGVPFFDPLCLNFEHSQPVMAAGMASSFASDPLPVLIHQRPDLPVNFVVDQSKPVNPSHNGYPAWRRYPATMIKITTRPATNRATVGP